MMAGCGGGEDATTTAAQDVIHGYVGNVAADEPSSAMLARNVLARGGNAVDAATALGLSLAVTLPSRASLGGGGACVVYRPSDRNSPSAFIFLPASGHKASASSDRPAAVPMMLRGLYLMHDRYGSVNFGDMVALAKDQALKGVVVSQALANDLQPVSSALFADKGARAVFSRKNVDGGATPLVAGDTLVQKNLAAFLERVQAAGPGDMHNGALAQIFAQAAGKAGGGLTKEDLRKALPQEVSPLHLSAGDGVDLAFLPPPADGGLGAAAAFSALSSGAGEADSVAQQAVAAWRQSGHSYADNAKDVLGGAQSLLASGQLSAGRTLPALPASTSYAVVDRNGMAVSCALTMNNLFGTGRIAGQTGVVLGASPARLPQPLLSAAIAYKDGRFIGAVAASGQNHASAAAAAAMKDLLAHHDLKEAAYTSMGRVNAVACPEGLPGDGESCSATTDVRGYGLAVGSH